ncbi:hypothetical protein [Streptomyces fradiae]|uniref:hypothetical protein n=1 Tax=Streptomyces fradiae TaxID=1906 RepID=UPI0035BE363C
MASGRDEDRRLAEIERLLAREDPDLDARMSALAGQLAEDSASPPPHRRLRGRPDPAAGTDGTDGAGGERGSGEGPDWRKVVALVAVVVAVVGLVLTAILSQPSGGAGGGTDPPTPAGLQAPADPAPP